MTIKPVDFSLTNLIKTEIDSKTKPLGSLGKIEDLALKLGLIYKTTRPVISSPTLFLCAGDHGITESGVSAYPAEVTAQMLLNFANGGAAINILASACGINLEFVNAGVDMSELDKRQFFNRPIANGTKNFAQSPAMTASECESAINLGKDRVFECVSKGTNFTLLGEMGIGNTSSAAIITSLITGAPLHQCVGRGTGLDEPGLQNKRDVLSGAVVFHGDIKDPLKILQIFGGLEIAALVGIIFAAAQSGCAILVDGYITTSAALIAVAMEPNVAEYLIYSHLSREPGHRIALDHLRGTQILSLDLCLGEGSGAALAFPIVKAASEILCEMATFESAAVSTAKSEAQ
jgi:nicotinate-nucleotide--dimethylbenzimidazole phosphoribosyltransferase